MGSERQELFDELDSLEPDDPRIPKIQERINEIEKWMIKRNYIKSITKWGDSNISPIYPYHTGAVYLEDLGRVASFNNEGLNYTTTKAIHVCKMCR
ncbi:hypothetical protein [Nitrosopumilus sp.]|uniref:hypothetical protein n=1 Tax=Nitrosopumilus sp. TaxID=2024843 RepID=UPI003D1427D0